jgi:PAS domain S-box-containing protein
MTRDPDDHRSELLEYAGRVAATDDEQTVYEAMADTADRVLAFDSSVVETESDGFLEVRAWAGDEPVVDGIPADQGIAGHTYRSGESERVSDISDDPRVENAAESPHDSVLSEPIGTVGVFQAGRYEPDAFDDDDVELAELLASHAAQAVQRIRSQHELTESEARFRRLFEQAEDALVLYDVASDRSTDIVYANDAAESLFDRTERDLQGESLGELLDLDDRDELVPDSEHEVETPLTNRSPERIVSVRVRPFLRESGPDAFAVIRDVTERRHRERTLTRLHDATRHMMAVESTTSIADLVVDAAERLFELPYVGVFVPRDEKLHLVAHSEDVPGEDLPVFEPGESLAWEVFEDGEPRMYEDVSDEPNAHNQDTILRQEVIHPLGDHGVLVVGASERDAFDRADRDLLRVLATNSEAALDRAARIRMLSRRESELRDERNRLAALFENIPSPTASFVVEDGSPIVRSVNPAFERVFGYSGDQLEGEPIDDYVVPMENEDAPEHIVNKLERGESFSGEVQRVTANGPRHFLLDVVPFRLDEPHVHGYAMYTDITDRLKRERELKRQNDRLDEFASIVSHDLRNPLNVARGYLELASETGDDVHFRRADDALDRMNDIIDDVQHSSEYSCDTITPMMHLRPEAQVWKQRALQLTDLMRSLWAGRNERGFLQFKSAFLNADEIDERPRHACDTLCHTRVTQPTLLLWQRTGDEALGELFTDWMDTWVDATARAERGKPAGVVPPAIHWPDGHVGGVGDQWWYPEIFPDREVSSPFTWPGKMSNMLNTLLLTADMTGDEKYVEPIRSMARVWEKHAGRSTSEHPEPGSEAWCAQRMEDFLPAVLAKYRVLAGDTQFDALWRSDADGYASYRFAGDRQALEEGLTENAEAFRKNFPAFTSEVCYTDRVLSFDSNYQKYYASEPLPRSRPGLLYSAVTGDPGGAGYFPMNAVRWLTEPREIAALVTEAGEERFAAELYHFGEEPREMGARFYLLSPGTYEATLERAADGSTVEQRSMTVEGLSSQTAFELPARELCRLRLCRLRVRPR